MCESFEKRQLEKMSVSELQKHVANLIAHESKIEIKLTNAIAQNKALSKKLVGGEKPAESRQKPKKEQKEQNVRSEKEEKAEKPRPKSSRQAETKKVEGENAPDSKPKGQGKGKTKQVYVKKEPVDGVVRIKQEDVEEERKEKKQE